jgi:DNA-binding MarR family transcriptional regulator
MSDTNDTLAVSLFSEIFVVDQLARGQLTKALPKGMEISHFSVLNHLAHIHDERSPAQLARAFNVTRGAMTNTLQKLETAGHVHIRPDWDDARRKFVAISPSGVSARDAAIAAIAPLVTEVVKAVGADKVRTMLPVLRELRIRLSSDD